MTDVMCVVLLFSFVFEFSVLQTLNLDLYAISPAIFFFMCVRVCAAIYMQVGCDGVGDRLKL